MTQGPPSARPLAPRWLWGVVGALVLGSVVMSLHMMRDVWFYADAWAYLTRPLTFRELFEPHAGHWTIFNLLITKLLLALGGMEYWPLWVIPRVLVWPALCLTLWWVTIRRGADVLVATAFLGVLLFFSSTGWIQSWLIGNQIAHVMAALLGHLVFSVREPSPRHQVRASAALVIAVMSAGVGVALLLGFLAVVVVTRAGRRWWPSGLVGLLVYGAWYVGFGGGGDAASLSALASFPSVAFEMAQVGVERLLRIHGILASLTVVGIAVWTTWLLFTRKLTAGDGVHLFTAVIFIALATIVRVESGSAQVTAVRYTYTISLLVIPVLVSRLPAPRRLIPSLLVVVLAALCAWGNVGELERRVAFRETYSQRSQDVVVSAASLLLDGEPAVDRNSVDFPRAGQLSVARLRRLVQNGWRPESLGVDDVAISSARGDLRISSWPTRQEGHNCRPLAVGENSFSAHRPLIIRASERAQVEVRARGSHGNMVQDIPTNRQDQWVRIFKPEGVQARLVVEGEAIEACEGSRSGP